MGESSRPAAVPHLSDSRARRRLVREFSLDLSDLRRHPGDILRVAVGLTAFIMAGLAIRRGTVAPFEADLFRLINDLPDWLAPPLVALMRLASLVAVAVAVAAALMFRRLYLARDVAVAGVLAWALAILSKMLVVRGSPAALLSGVILRTGEHATGLGYPSGHVAVAAALATAASPHLSRLARRLTWIAVFIVAIARVYVGDHLPLDAFGGAALGWAVAAALHLLWGAPASRSSLAEVRAAIRDVGLTIAELTPAEVDARGSTPFLARTADGRDLFLKVIDRAQRDADLLFRGWRFIAFREVEDGAPFATPKRLIEHEAYLSILAERAGVRTPSIVGTVDLPEGAAMLVQQRIAGVTLDRFPHERISDALLRDIWQQVATLHGVRIAHGDLRNANILIDASGKSWVLDMGFAETSATDRRLTRDVAELMASLAGRVGAERAVAAGLEVLGPDALAEALPLLQPLALTTATRNEVRKNGILEELRQHIADRLGRPLEPPEKMKRFRLRTLVLILGLGFAVHLLLPQVGQLRQTLEALREGRWGWLVGAIAASAWTYVAAAMAIIAASGRVMALGRTIAVQLASSFANRMAPAGVGGMSVNTRYLEALGMERGEAIAAVMANVTAGFTVHAATLPIALAGAGVYGIAAAHLPNAWPILLAVALVLALTGIVWAIRTKRFKGVRQAIGALTSLATDPRRLAALLASALGVTVGNVLGLYMSLRVFGVNTPLVDVAAAYLAGEAIGAASPTPGGLGATEAALVAGLTVLDVPTAPAVAAVLVFRLTTYWLPILPGALAFHSLSRRNLL